MFFRLKALILDCGAKDLLFNINENQKNKNLNMYMRKMQLKYKKITMASK